MTNVKIDDDVPMPPHGGGRGDKWPYRKVNVGESWFMPGKGVNVVSSQVSGWKLKTGFRYASRTVTENGVKGVRVWRIE